MGNLVSSTTSLYISLEKGVAGILVYQRCAICCARRESTWKTFPSDLPWCL